MKKQYQYARAVAFHAVSNFGGIELLEVDYTDDCERVYYALNFGTRQKVRFSKVYFSDKGDYIKTPLGKVYLDYCLAI